MLPAPDEPILRDLGEQPIQALMVAHSLKAKDLVECSPDHITHKMVARACKGRRLTPHVQRKIVAAVNLASGRTYSVGDLFNY